MNTRFITPLLTFLFINSCIDLWSAPTPPPPAAPPGFPLPSILGFAIAAVVYGTFQKNKPK